MRPLRVCAIRENFRLRLQLAREAIFSFLPLSIDYSGVSRISCWFLHYIFFSPPTALYQPRRSLPHQSPAQRFYPPGKGRVTCPPFCYYLCRRYSTIFLMSTRGCRAHPFLPFSALTSPSTTICSHPLGLSRNFLAL